MVRSLSSIYYSSFTIYQSRFFVVIRSAWARLRLKAGAEFAGACAGFGCEGQLMGDLEVGVHEPDFAFRDAGHAESPADHVATLHGQEFFAALVFEHGDIAV